MEDGESKGSIQGAIAEGVAKVLRRDVLLLEREFQRILAISFLVPKLLVRPYLIL